MIPTMRLPARAALLALVPLVPWLSSDEGMRSSDQKKLGKEVADYFQAKDEKSGIDKAYQDIADSVDRVEKRLDGKSALALVDDWQQIFYQARLDALGDELKVRKGKPHEASAQLRNGKEVDFAVSVPGSYNPRRGPYPLYLVIGKPDQTPLVLVEEQWSEALGSQDVLLVAPKMPDDTSVWGEVNVSGPSGVATVMSLYGEFLRQFPIDMNRVYLVGYGAGADAAGRLAGLYPHLFAGLVLFDAGTGVDARNFRSLPTLVVGASEDAQATARSIEKLGYDNATPKESATAADVFAWTADKVRDAYPDEITFVPLTQYTTSSNWISAEGVNVEDGASVHARVDRERNAIVVDAEMVSSVRVFLNDRLVDMDEPVDVIVNGVSKKATVDRNMRLMLDLFYNIGDWGRVFTNRLQFDVPPPGTTR